MSKRSLISLALLSLLAAALLFIPDALAQQAPNCTADFPDAQGPGIFSTIVTQVQNILNNVSQNMFIGIVSDPGFRTAISALATLYVAVYGILFTFGMTQITLIDFAIRLIKIGIIIILLSANAWAWFGGTVVYFFNNGTDSLINAVTAIAVGGVTMDPNAPFSMLDAALANALSAKMAVSLLATFTTGPYGPLIGLLIAIALWSFLKMMINALWIYVMSLVLKTLLFGLAPIFIACLLFQRTRHLFDGWLNQVVNASLQPLFVFIFIFFFVTLIQSGMAQLLSYNICWTQLPDPIRGAPSLWYFWRYNINNQMAPGVAWGWNGADIGGGPVFPIPILLPLMVWLLADIGERSIGVCVEAAQDIAGAATDLRMGSESLGQMFGSVGSGLGKQPEAPAGGPAAGVRPGAVGQPAGRAGLGPSTTRQLSSSSRSNSSFAPGAGSRGTPGKK